MNEPDEEYVALRGLQALALAPTLTVYRALLRGEHVPRSVLCPDALQRFYCNTDEDFVVLEDFDTIPKPLKEKRA